MSWSTSSHCSCSHNNPVVSTTECSSRFAHRDTTHALLISSGSPSACWFLWRYSNGAGATGVVISSHALGHFRCGARPTHVFGSTHPFMLHALRGYNTHMSALPTAPMLDATAPATAAYGDWLSSSTVPSEWKANSVATNKKQTRSSSIDHAPAHTVASLAQMLAQALDAALPPALGRFNP